MSVLISETISLDRWTSSSVYLVEVMGLWISNFKIKDQIKEKLLNWEIKSPFALYWFHLEK